jgi:sigma-B regulation protein RsbU (phosphoserine phosphatase)
VGEELGTDGLMTMLARYRDLQSLKLLEALVWGLSEYTAGQDFPDDVSGVVIDYLGK